MCEMNIVRNEGERLPFEACTDTLALHFLIGIYRHHRSDEKTIPKTGSRTMITTLNNTYRDSVKHYIIIEAHVNCQNYRIEECAQIKHIKGGLIHPLPGTVTTHHATSQ